MDFTNDLFSTGPLSRLGVSLQNTLMKASGRSAVDTAAFKVDFPDSRCAAEIREGVRLLSKAISFPFNKIKTRWFTPLSGDRTTSVSSDAALAGYALAFCDPAAAREILMPFFAAQEADGSIPGTISPMAARNRATPLLLRPLLQAHAAAPDPAALGDCLARAMKYADFLAAAEAGEDGFFHPAACGSLDPFLSFPPGPSYNADPPSTIHFGANCAWIIFWNSIADAAARLDQPREARKYRNRAKKLARLLHEAAWDPERGGFFDMENGARVADPSPAAFLALPAEAVNRREAEMIIAAARENPRLTRPRDSRHMLTLTLFLEGMAAYGFRTEAGALAVETARNVAAEGTNRENFLLAAAALPLLVRHAAGYIAIADKLALAPALPPEWTGKPVTIHDSRAARMVTMTLTDGGTVRCHVRAAGGPDTETEIENGKFRSFTADETPREPEKERTDGVPDAP